MFFNIGVKNKEKLFTPKIARKISNNAVIQPTSYEDCINDIKLRASRGYTWTVMLQLTNETIDELIENDWEIKIMSENNKNNTYMVSIKW